MPGPTAGRRGHRATPGARFCAPRRLCLAYRPSLKLLMLVAVGLSARLNYEHEALLGYPLVGRVLFVAPSVLSGWLFELQLRR
jgi:hypothetical protein